MLRFVGSRNLIGRCLLIRVLSMQRLVSILITGGIAALAIVSFVWLFGLVGERSIAKVDFDDVAMATEGVVVDSESALPVLRVAIAAMISPETTKEYYGDLMRLIGERTGRRTVILQRKTYAEVNKLIENKEVDLAFVCAGPYVDGREKFGMEILATPVINGKTVYRSYILAPRGDGIESFHDLRDKTFAFTDPDSNTGTLVPKFMLAELGETPKSFFGETFLTYSHDNSIKAVAEGLADGAAVDSLIWEFMNSTDPRDTSRTKIIERSPAYGNPPVVVHPDLEPRMKQRLREVLLSLHKDEEAAILLRKLKIDRFEAGDDEMYDSIRVMLRVSAS